MEGRGRLVFAGALAAGLLVVVLVVALTRSGGSSADPADPDCVSAWNDDPAAVSLGVHQFSGHGYELVQIARLDQAGEPTDSGDCAVVFAATTLDAELGAAAQFLGEQGWRPLSERPGITPERLGELQSEANDEVNASLGDD